MDEYASILLMLRWEIATTLPYVMVIIASIAKVYWISTLNGYYARIRTLNAATNPIFFEPAASRADTTLGEPSYVSGAHIWNGTSAILKPNPATRKIIARIPSELSALR